MANVKAKGLGKGIDSLLPTNFDSSILVDEHERIQKISVDDISPNKHQPRTSFDQQALVELSESIKRHGVLQPIVLTNEPDGKYSIVAGERRWRASKLASLSHVPSIVRSAQELERLEIALVENVQRVDLSPLEQAKSIQTLHDQFNMDYDSISKRLGKANTTVINIVRLLGLPESAQKALNERKITEGHARSILALKDAQSQTELLELIIKNGWSVRQAEQFVTAKKQGAKSTKKAQEKTSQTTPQTERLSSILKAPVTLKRMAKGGRLEIAYKNETDLTRIIKRLSN